MTSKNDVGLNTESSGENDNDVNKENNDKLNNKGAATSSKQQEVKKSFWASPMFITIALALPAAAVIAYVYMPDELSRYLSFDNSSNVATSVTHNNAQEQISVAPNSTVMNSNIQTNHNDWVAEQRADFDKRRAEFQQRNAVNFDNQWASQPLELPQWVKDRQVEIEKQRAEIEKHRKQYMQEMVKQQNRWVNNRGYNQPAQNTYYQNAPVNNQPQLPPQQVKPYGPNQAYNPYYRQARPYYPPAPMYNNRPYGYTGYGYK
ncbi:MAG: hypothetical protein QM504_06010 [Pseudomonadota bacterium]